MKTKVLVTGGAGFIGQQFMNRFNGLDVNVDYTVLDKLLYCDEYMLPYKFIYGDVSDVQLMKKILPKFDIVIHLAGIVGEAACAIRPDETQKTNVNSVQILKDYFGGKIIFLSSCSVYGASDGILTEESEVNPLSLYAETKLVAEELLKEKNAICLRLGTMHGVSSRPRFDIVVNTLAIRALLTKEISVFGGNQWRPLLGMNDVTDALYSVSTFESLKNITGIFNVSGQNLRIIDIADKVVKLIPGTKIKRTNAKFEDNRNYRVSTAKAEKVLDFCPQHFIEKTINDVKRLHKEGRIKDYSNLKYSNVSKLNFEFK